MATEPFTFLILDDDADNRFLNRHALEKKFPQATVVECSSINEALDCCSSVCVDAIVTDHHLAGPDGAAFIKGVRSRGVRCPVVMVTASADPRVKREAYAAGASCVFNNGDYGFPDYLQTVLSHGAFD
jgi:CheY-like chemotaxis protein